MKIYQSADELIGKTPLLELKKTEKKYSSEKLPFQLHFIIYSTISHSFSQF